LTESRLTLKCLCRRLEISPRMVRSYLREGLIEVSEMAGAQPLFDRAALDRLAKIRRLRCDLGVNLAGIDIILRLCSRIEELQAEIERLRGEVKSGGPGRGAGRTFPARVIRRDMVRVEVVGDE